MNRTIALTLFSIVSALLVPSGQVGAAAPAALIEDVQHLREEEKLARDVYRALYEKWSLPMFDNISQAEQRHFDRMGRLLDRYEATDPVRDDTAGVFTNPELGALYESLVKRGLTSEMDALMVGATIEDLDIRDIRNMTSRTDDTEALEAFRRLECGSRNHMRAFIRQIEARSKTYEAQDITAAELRAIVESPHERCGHGSGKGGRGGGRGQNGGGPHGPHERHENGNQ